MLKRISKRVSANIIACVLISTLLLGGCYASNSATQSQSSKETISESDSNSQLEQAKKFIQDTKEEMKKTVKEDYFESDEWKAFVDAYWKGYNSSQEKMKEPQLINIEDIEY